MKIPISLLYLDNTVDIFMHLATTIISCTYNGLSMKIKK